jgi:hypothetical protein
MANSPAFLRKQENVTILTMKYDPHTPFIVKRNVFNNKQEKK